MHARIAEITAKPDKLNEVRNTMNRDIAPVLKKQTGFVDAIALVSDTAPNTIVSITIWHTKAEADRYGNTQFPKFTEMLNPLITGYTVRTYQVENSTFHKIAAGKVA
jgi:quinol monooxygenase YgiN